MQTISDDIAALSDAIFADWENGYADLLMNAGKNDFYRSTDEAIQELFKAATTGFQFTIDARLGRPLGTFDKPRPKQAEARRSGRSLRHVDLAVHSAKDLAVLLSGENEKLVHRYRVLSGHIVSRIAKIDDPVFAGVADAKLRVKVEIIQQTVQALLDHSLTELAPHLGVSPGFSALDGD